MPSFTVRFTESTQYEITIEAEDSVEAIQKIRALDYDPGEASQMGGVCVDIDSVVAV
jgi:hypothetical protein